MAYLRSKFWPLILLLIIALSPQGRQAFSEITQLTVTEGTIEYLDDCQVIKATGHRDSVIWKVTCIWRSGRPQVIWYHDPKTEL